jgi:hypothetical protein
MGMGESKGSKLTREGVSIMFYAWITALAIAVWGVMNIRNYRVSPLVSVTAVVGGFAVCILLPLVDTFRTIIG